MLFTAPPVRPQRKPDINPILFSALIFPGLGQFYQKRYGAALLYASAGLLASALFVFMLWQHGRCALSLVWKAWTSGIDPETTRATFLPILKSAGFLIGLHLANVYDAWYAWYRSHRAWRESESRPGS